LVFFGVGSLILLGKPRWPSTGGLFRRVSLFLGGGSYALYVIHTPILFLSIAFVSYRPLRFAVLVTAVALAVIVMEYIIQPRCAALIDRFTTVRRPQV
jgi:peptidoglycan/LPS O-acetylase OafA/YrhL